MITKEIEMHFADISSSTRLQRILKVLQKGGKFTTRDLIRKSGQCAINSIVSEIRANGIAVECERVKNRWYYWLSENA